MKNLTPKLATILLLALSIVACKKDKDDDGGNNQNPATPVCRIVATEEGGTTQTFYYDEKGRLTTVVGFDGTDSTYQRLVYTGNVVSVSVDGQPGGQTIYLNSKGFLDSAEVETALGSIYVKVNYSEQFLPLKQTIKGSIGPIEIDQEVAYEWTNGNITKQTVTFDGDENYFVNTFNTSKPNQLYGLELASGFFPTSVNEMVKTNYSDDTEDNYTYTYDTDGRLKSRTLVDYDNETTVTNYTWSCK